MNSYRYKVQSIVDCNLEFQGNQSQHEGILSMMAEKVEIKMPKTNDKPQLSSCKSKHSGV